jgi:putative oxidoreductase
LLGAIFFISGLDKVADPAGTLGYITSAGLPLPQLALATAIAVESSAACC